MKILQKIGVECCLAIALATFVVLSLPLSVSAKDTYIKVFTTELSPILGEDTVPIFRCDERTDLQLLAFGEIDQPISPDDEDCYFEQYDAIVSAFVLCGSQLEGSYRPMTQNVSFSGDPVCEPQNENGWPLQDWAVSAYCKDMEESYGDITPAQVILECLVSKNN